jgi:hypothetical protein
MGVIVLPAAMATIIFSVVIMFTMILTVILSTIRDINHMQSVNYQIFHSFEFDMFLLERAVFSLLSNPIAYFFVVFLILMIFYMFYGKTYVKEHTSIRLSLIFFLTLYALLFSFWWTVSFFYLIFNKKVV